MAELTLESLAKRVEALEAQLKQPKREKDWRRTIGMFADNDFMPGVFEEAAKIREADRDAGRNKAISNNEP